MSAKFIDEEENFMREFKDLGITQFIVKPIDQEMLVKKVQIVLHK